MVSLAAWCLLGLDAARMVEARAATPVSAVGPIETAIGSFVAYAGIFRHAVCVEGIDFVLAAISHVAAAASNPDVSNVAAAPNQDVGLPPRAALTTLITVESLIFAAFAITVTLALPTDAGRSAFFTQGWFGGLVIVVLTVIAAAGMHALVATLEPAPPAGWNAWARAVGVAVGICAQPLLAVPITIPERCGCWS